MKKAVSLIELIIAIVIMGITVTALPSILTQADNSNIFALRQDAILAAKTKLKGVMSHEWDSTTFDPIDVKSYIVTTNSTNAQLISRAGLVPLSGRRSYDPSGAGVRVATAIPSSPPTGTFQSINDFNAETSGVAQSVIMSDGNLNDAKNLDYIFKNMQLVTNVSYINDNGLDFSGNTAVFNFSPNAETTGSLATTSNIKRVAVNVGIDADQAVSLQSFVFNLGESLTLDPREF